MWRAISAWLYVRAEAGDELAYVRASTNDELERLKTSADGELKRAKQTADEAGAYWQCSPRHQTHLKLSFLS
jgi:hypothetical protein